MKVNLFTIADSVNVYEGKLVIVGTFDNIQAEECPFVFRPFGFALKASVEPHEYGKTYDCRLVLKKIRAKKPVAEVSLKMNFPKQQKGRKLSVVFAGNIGGVKFDSFGSYVLECKIGSKVVSQIDVNVVKKESANKAKQKGKAKQKQ